MLIVGSILPALYNRNVAKALGSRSIEKRLQVYQSLHSLYGYPPEVLRRITEIYTGALVRNFDALKNNQKAREEIPIELGAILDLYEFQLFFEELQADNHTMNVGTEILVSVAPYCEILGLSPHYGCREQEELILR